MKFSSNNVLFLKNRIWYRSEFSITKRRQVSFYGVWHFWLSGVVEIVAYRFLVSKMKLSFFWKYRVLLSLAPAAPVGQFANNSNEGVTIPSPTTIRRYDRKSIYP